MRDIIFLNNLRGWTFFNDKLVFVGTVHDVLGHFHSSLKCGTLMKSKYLVCVFIWEKVFNMILHRFDAINHYRHQIVTRWK